MLLKFLDAYYVSKKGRDSINNPGTSKSDSLNVETQESSIHSGLLSKSLSRIWCLFILYNLIAF